ncbi:MAG: beta-propeller domain-containing protein [Desulfamplus sp.]|nr:beta-propeller domain-containing protein [Desulfamplus sp.]
MEPIYKSGTETVYDRHNGLKSLLYFILMVLLLCSMLFLPDKLYALDDIHALDNSHASGNIMLGAQIKDKAKFSGTLSGRFLKDFDKSDLYILAYPSLESETFSKEKLFSLTTTNSDFSELVWKNQISIFSAYDCIKAGGWGALLSIDFNPLKNQQTGDIQDLLFILLLVKQGGDPMNPTDWLDSAVTSLITDPGQRVPGQTMFVTDQDNNRYYPANINDSENVTPSPSENPDKKDDTSEVEKPDIYKISGNKLFYANGSAGRFQVVDISKPDNPRLIHSEYLQNTPLDLYVTDNYVILLEQMSERDDVSVVLKVFSVPTDGDNILKVAEQAYANMQYIASRKSGNRIFITGTTPSYYIYEVDIVADESVTGGEAGGSQVAAIDISNPTSPTLISRKSLEGYDSDIYLNSDYLVQIARVSWDTTVLHLFDLNQSDPLAKIAEVKIPGRVPSEYHVNISDNALFVIYRDQDIKKGSSLKIFEIMQGSELDIIPENVTGKSELKEMGSVDGIAPGEDLFAGTFTDDRAYIVTYERKDPLWVVDISDHAAPKIMGELEVPGWSEYIRFHKNRLIALGYDDSDGKRRVSVALFSVEDPLKPVLLDRVTPLSGISDYTYSVGIDDDRGFYWNTSSGIIMVPISYYTDGNYSGLEILHVDSNWNAFEWKDFVEADFNVQRGTEADNSGSQDNLKDIALSMGDSALNTINIKSGEKPVILGELRLAYNAEKIVLYENMTNEDVTNGSVSNQGNSGIQGEQSIFALGGDFYTNGTSDLMRYDSKPSNQTGEEQFDFTAPGNIVDSELLYPELLMDKKSFGVIFSWGSSAFRLFDQKTMKMGDIVKLGDLSSWSTSNPIVSNNQIYFALSQYVYPQYENPETDEISYNWNAYSLNTTLKRYDCKDFNAPKQLPDISIPGTPSAVFNETRLITVETSRYFYPYYYASNLKNNTESESANANIFAADASNSAEAPAAPPIDSIEPTIMPPPPENPDIPQGTRINAVDLGQNSGVLDKTAFFDQTEYGYSEVICDEETIYLVAMKDDQTDIHKIDKSTLKIVNTYTVKGSFSPVKASMGRIVLTSRGGYYPYRMICGYKCDPYWNNNEIKVVDISGGILKELTTFSSDLYASQNNTVMANDGIYIANGYRGVVYFPFKQ